MQQFSHLLLLRTLLHCRSRFLSGEVVYLCVQKTDEQGWPTVESRMKRNVVVWISTPTVYVCKLERTQPSLSVC